MPSTAQRGLFGVTAEEFVTYHAAGTSWNIYDTVANGAAKVSSVCASHQIDPSDARQITALSDKTRELASRRFASSRGRGASYPMRDNYHEPHPGY